MSDDPKPQEVELRRQVAAALQLPRERVSVRYFTDPARNDREMVEIGYRVEMGGPGLGNRHEETYSLLGSLDSAEMIIGQLAAGKKLRAGEGGSDGCSGGCGLIVEVPRGKRNASCDRCQTEPGWWRARDEDTRSTEDWFRDELVSLDRELAGLALEMLGRDTVRDVAQAQALELVRGMILAKRLVEPEKVAEHDDQARAVQGVRYPGRGT